MASRDNADWCADNGAVAVCGTSMEEYKREPMGERWCFSCRKRHEFAWVYTNPTGLSYYGPSAHVEGITIRCTDLFPGWYREAVDY